MECQDKSPQMFIILALNSVTGVYSVTVTLVALYWGWLPTFTIQILEAISV